MTEDLESRVVISGIGRSHVGRRLFRDPLDLTLDACLEAVANAGLKRHDINGLVTYPGLDAYGPGFGGPGVARVQDALRLKLDWYVSGSEGLNPLGLVIEGGMAVSTGMARHTLVYLTMYEASARAQNQRPSEYPPNEMSGYLTPFGAVSPAQWAGLSAARHFYEYGTTSEQLGSVAIQQRRHAALNPFAIYRDDLSMAEYLDSRMVSSPLRLYDCDVFADGAIAFVLSPAAFAADSAAPAIWFEAVGASRWGRGLWELRSDMTTMTAHDAAAAMWRRTCLSPADVDVAHLYDGFSIFVLMWLEALGFCPPGESGAYVEGGDPIGLGSSMPVNTDGGQLSAGRFPGMGHLYEACLQLRGLAGDRQVQGAEVAIVAAGGGNVAQSLLLRGSR